MGGVLRHESSHSVASLRSRQYGDQVPISWLKLLDCLMGLAQRDEQTRVPLEHVLDIAASECYIQSREEVTLFLKLFNDTGLLMFFDEEDAR